MWQLTVSTMAAEQGESKPLARRALSGAVAAIASIGVDATQVDLAPAPARGVDHCLSIKTAGLALRESCGECQTAARRRQPPCRCGFRLPRRRCSKHRGAIPSLARSRRMNAKSPSTPQDRNQLDRMTLLPGGTPVTLRSRHNRIRTADCNRDGPFLTAARATVTI